MSVPLSVLGHEPGFRNRPENKRRGRGLGCLAGLLAVVMLVAGGYLLYNAGVSALKDLFTPAADYEGPGKGSVLVEVRSGDNASDIADTLADEDVVASREAFVDAANAEPASRRIQVGFYEMRREMAAQDALDVLIDPANMIQSSVTVPEGRTVAETVAILAKATDIPQRRFESALARPGSLGLPAYAGGDPEGFLFPATYAIRPDATARSVLTMMVDRFEQAAMGRDLPRDAAAAGLTPHEAVTIASLIQAEAGDEEDFAKISRVVYNRLERGRRLQFDSTVHYAVGRDGSVGTSDEERAVDSPYNTYRYRGLPPGPINSPGEQALEAALHPADGDWLYFVTTNPDTGETKFAETHREHLRYKAEFEQWCAQSEDC